MSQSQYIYWEGRWWSDAEFETQVRAWEQQLHQRHLQSGDRIAVLAWNHLQTVALFHACAGLGVSLVFLNARLTPRELEIQIKLAGPKWIVSEKELLEKMDAPKELPRPRLQAAPADRIAACLFTSGTTGVPKLIELSHGNFQAHARANALHLGGESTQRWLLCLPLFHVGALAIAYRCALYEASMILHRQFDAQGTIAAIEQHGVTHASLVSTMLLRIMGLRGETPFAANLKAILIGGGPVPEAMLKRAKELKLPVLQTYGLTEACSQVCTESLEHADGSSSGKPLPGIDVRIVQENGQAAPGGEVGEIHVSGPTVALQFEGRLKTGDLGHWDEKGRLHVLSRRVDLIIRGGENIYPVEVEQVIAAHPSVLECVVTGINNAEWGQIPIAWVVLKKERIEDLKALQEWCSTHLAKYKIPSSFRLLDEIPRNANGKVDRSKLKE